MPLRPHHVNARGSATLLMVLMVTVIITVGLGFNWLVKEHLLASESLEKKAEAITVARSACDTLLYLLLAGKPAARDVELSGVESVTMLKKLPINNAPVHISDGVTVWIQDSNGLLPLTGLNTRPLTRLLGKALPAEDPGALVVALQDWNDLDDLARVNGAESDYYRKAKRILPRNASLRYEEELGFVRGFSPEAGERLRGDVTLLPVTGFNPNTAPDEVLAAYLDIDAEILKKIRAWQKKSDFHTESALEALIGHRPRRGRYDVYCFEPSRFMDITVSAGEPKHMYTIRAGVGLQQSKTAPYSVLYWREE